MARKVEKPDRRVHRPCGPRWPGAPMVPGLARDWTAIARMAVLEALDWELRTAADVGSPAWTRGVREAHLTVRLDAALGGREYDELTDAERDQIERDVQADVELSLQVATGEYTIDRLPDRMRWTLSSRVYGLLQLPQVAKRMTDGDVLNAARVWCVQKRSRPDLPGDKWTWLTEWIRRLGLGDIESETLRTQWEDWRRERGIPKRKP